MSARVLDGLGWLAVSAGLLLVFWVVVRINAPKSTSTHRHGVGRRS